MRDGDLVTFLRWASPRMGLRWKGFKNFRNTVRKRIARRMRALGLEDLSEYCARLEADPDEWGILDAMCRITISRLYRGRAAMDVLRDVVFPSILADGRRRGSDLERRMRVGRGAVHDRAPLASRDRGVASVGHARARRDRR